jgi:hypothetical protein
LESASLDDLRGARVAHSIDVEALTRSRSPPDYVLEYLHMRPEPRVTEK